jgi:hypothetical protein
MRDALGDTRPDAARLDELDGAWLTAWAAPMSEDRNGLGKGDKGSDCAAPAGRCQLSGDVKLLGVALPLPADEDRTIRATKPVLARLARHNGWKIGRGRNILRAKEIRNGQDSHALRIGH